MSHFLRFLLLILTSFWFSQASALQNVTLQLKWHHQFQFAGYYAAKELGYYREAGLAVTIKPVAPDQNPISNVLNGGAQFGVGSNDLLLHRQKGEPVVALAVIFQHSPYVLLALKKKELNSIPDLIGKRVMFDPYATEIIAYLHAVGISMDRIIKVQSNDYHARDLLSGKIDAYAAYSTNDPFYLEQAGKAYLAFSPREVGIDFYGDNLFTTEKELKYNPERTRAFLDASLRGWRYAIKNPQKVVDLMIEKGYVAPAERSKLLYEADKSLELMHSELVDVGYMNVARWQHIIDTYAKMGMLPTNFSLDGFLYNPEHKEVPAWLYPLLGLVLGVAALLSAWTFTLRRQVEVRTSSLTQIHDKMKLHLEALDSHALVHSFDEQGVILYANESLAKISGYPSGELIGQNQTVLLSEVNLAVFSAQVLAELSRNQIWQGDICNRAKDGHLYWINSTYAPCKIKAGKTIEWIVISTNITQRKADELELRNHRVYLEEMVQLKTEHLNQAIESLRLSEEKYRLMLDESSDPIFIFNRDVSYRYVNQAFLRFYGRKSAEIIGKTPGEIFPPEQAEIRLSFIGSIFDSGETNTIEVLVSGFEGDRYLLTTAKPIKNAQHQVTAVMCISKDITERRQAEQAAHAANRAKSVFLANMSHEIRTPMNGVIGMVDILQRTGLTPEQKRMVGTIQDSSLALLHILNDILDYSKLEAGKLGIELLATCLREVVEGVAQLMAVISNTRSIELTVFVSPELPRWIACDPMRLRQVLLNLVGNAVKFTSSEQGHQGRVLLSAEPCTLTTGAVGLQLRVIDNGIGISANTLTHLFQPFSQADESIARNFGGTGLGLIISKRLTEMLGGRISVSSVLGEGSTFTLELPLQESAPPGNIEEEPSLAGVKVLAVMRDEVFANIVSNYCVAAGAEIVVVKEIESVDLYIREHPISVLILGILASAKVGELELPPGIGVVRLVPRSVDSTTRDVVVPARPLLYRELLRGVAMACGRISRDSSEVQAPKLKPLPDSDHIAEQLILVAEDDATNREVMLEQLQVLGYSSEMAKDGQTAFEMWKSGRYALLLTDCHMPGMDGFALTAAIRQAETNGMHIPIIAVTANALQGESQRCLDSGMDDYLAKPLRLNDLSAILGKWLTAAPTKTAVNPLSEMGLPAMPGFETTGALQRMNGKIETYRRILCMFREHNATMLVDIHLANERGDQSELKLLLHRLKGTALTIGAVDLAAVAAQLEDAVDNTQVVLEEAALQSLEREWTIVRKTLSTL